MLKSCIPDTTLGLSILCTARKRTGTSSLGGGHQGNFRCAAKATAGLVPRALETLKRHGYGYRILICAMNDGGYGSEFHKLLADGKFRMLSRRKAK